MRAALSHAPGADRPLRIALLAYRGNPYCGGQGVYVRYLSRELVAAGHEVTVLSGQPYPHLEDDVRLVKLAGLDLYREPDPFRRPGARELHSIADVVELATTWSGGFGEPRAFSLRARDYLLAHRDEFDLVHDNQCLGSGLLDLVARDVPLVASVHHPVTIDRALDLEHARTRRRALGVRRWYGFARMQARVARRVDRVVTVSQTAARDVCAEMGVDPSRLAVVPVGVDALRFAPPSDPARVAGRIMTTASADVPMKGLVHLLEALAKLRTERAEAHLVVVGRARPESEAAEAIARLGLEDAVAFLAGVSDEAIVEAYASAEVAVVPSLYEGFSLPAIEAMASAVPLVATNGGALPEVVGPDGEAALVVPTADPSALAQAISRLLDDRELAARLGAAGRRRVEARFTWARTAQGCLAVYRDVLERRRV